MSQAKPSINDAIRYIDIVLREEVLSKLGRQYLENAKTLLNGGQK